MNQAGSTGDSAIVNQTATDSSNRQVASTDQPIAQPPSSSTNNNNNNNNNNSNSNSNNTTTSSSNNITTNAPNTNSLNSNAQTTTTTTSFVPLTRARMRENLDNQDVVDINTIEELTGNPDAAKKARLSSHKLSEEEYAVFNSIIQDDVKIFEAYIRIRDTILEAWFENVQHELTKSVASQKIAELQDTTDENISQQMRELIFHRAFDFLDRTGRINFGLIGCQTKNTSHSPGDRTRRAPLMTSHLYKPPLKTNTKRTGRVIIIGAGLSGLTAARQLQRMGMEVIVLEARHRVGGRVHTYRKGNFIADLGPSSFNGVVGNPMVVIGRQLDLCVMELKQRIPIYEYKTDKNGVNLCHPVDSLLERAVEREYNKIMEGTRVLKTNYGIEKDYKSKPYCVGTAVNWVMTLQEKNIKDEQLKHLNNIDDLYQQLIESANQKLSRAKIIKTLEGQLCSIKDSMDIGNHKDKAVIETFQRRCVTRDLDIALREYKLLDTQERDINRQIAHLTENPPSDTYLSLTDRHLIDWHFAALEYALGCPINQLGIYYEDNEEIFDGSHWMLVHGFNTIVEAMRNELDVLTNTAVRKISVGKNGCKVVTYQPDHTYSPYVEYTADAVLCTLPLGVLQDSIIPSQKAALDSKTDAKGDGLPPRTNQKGYQPVIFNPQLPAWKTQAINRLGCGNLNKIVMSFDKVFWDHELHLFGVVSHKAVSRGEFFLFWHHGRTPTLTGLISGEAADIIERLSDVEILERCLVLLRSIFGTHNVPAPKDYVVTKWRKDPWARGAWSYLKTGTTGDDYEICSEPVVLDSDELKFKETRLSQTGDNSSGMKKVKSSDEVPRLFFAGEHTTKSYFASAHGAVLTGLREAARIANIFLGCPYDPDDEAGIVVS